MDRLEGGYLGAKPAWSASASPGVWTLSQALARRAAGTWPATSFLFDPYFESVSLLLHMNGSNASTTFVDSSLGNLAVTANGNAQISTAQSKFGGSSGAFDGTGDNLNIATPSSFLIDWAGGDFTLEYWIRCTAFPAASGSGSAPIVIGNMSNSADTNYWSFGPIGDGKVRFYYYNGAPVSFTTTSSLSLNTWHHLAFVKSGTGMTIYIDGISSATATVSGTPQFLSATGLSIGQYTNTSFNGYLDEIRLTKGVARYTSNFTVPGVGSDEGAALYDPYFDYVSLLLRCNGENNSTTFTDSSNNALAITRNGDTKISTTQARFGGASAYFDGTGDWLSCPNTNAQFSFGTGDFTYEFWFNSTDTKAYSALLTRPYTSPGGILISLNGSTGDGAPEIYWNEYLNGLFFKSSVTGLNNGRWHHFAFVRTGTTCYMFIDGAQVASKASVSTSVGSTPVYIGTDSVYAGRDYVGYIDDVRITKGVCRYSAAFRPVGPYATSGKLADPYLTSTSLLLPMTGDNGNTSFFDRSNNFLRATENGNAKVSTTQSKFGGTSVYFDGTGDFLLVPYASRLDLGTGDFTIEMWIYPADLNYRFMLGATVNSGSYMMLAINPTGSGQIWLGLSGVSWPLQFSGHTLTVNTWAHLAICRSGTSNYLFINGAQVGSTITNSQSWAIDPAGMYVGNQAGGSSWNGYIDDLRITKGAARYTSAFTPPERAFNDEAFNDPHYNAASLLLHMDGTNNSTTFTDSSVNGLTVTANGDAKISTAQSRFGGASGFFDGNGDYLTVADNDLLELGGSEFTLECWIYVTNLKGYQAIATKSYAAADQYGWGLIFETNNSIAFYAGNAGWSIAMNGGAIISVNTWYHVAATRSGNVWRLFVNGVQVATTTVAITLSGGTLPLYIGRYPYFPGFNSAQDFAGYIEEFRLTKGVARYTSNFTPPTLPFYNTTIPTTDPSFSSVSLLLHMNGTNGSTTFTDSSSNALAVTANGNAQISTAQSKFGGASAYLDGTGDYLTAASSALFGFGTGNFTIEYWWYPTRNSGNETLIDIRPSDTTTPLVLGKDGAGAVRCYDGASVRTGGTMTINAWNHVAWSRTGTSNQIFLNGVSVISFTNGFDAGTTRGLVIGSNVLTSAENCQGYIDDLRITKGVARYTSNFYIPRAAFPDA